jgi:hypothetical protein
MDDAPGFCRRLAEDDNSTSRRLGVGLNADFSQTWGSAFSVSLSRSSSRVQEHAQTVSVNLGDPSPYDFFAVRITQVSSFAPDEAAPSSHMLA